MSDHHNTHTKYSRLKKRSYFYNMQWSFSCSLTQLKCKIAKDQGKWPVAIHRQISFSKSDQWINVYGQIVHGKCAHFGNNLISHEQFYVHHEKKPFVKFQNMSINRLPQSLVKPFLKHFMQASKSNFCYLTTIHCIYKLSIHNNLYMQSFILTLG